MIAAGDTRPVTALANDLTNTSLTGSALASQKRRIAWGINRARSSATKNPAKNKRD
jgi:hypothetical protein